MTPTRTKFTMEESEPGPSTATNSVTVKIPPFWPADPELWFAQVEAQFTVKGITKQATKFAHVVAALSPEAATEVRDLILSPPLVNPFNRLKTALTERVSVSKRQKLQQLLHGEELGDRKPSQLLRRLQQLHTTSDSALLRELFLQRLPRSVQLSLLSLPDKSLDELALIADSMLELEPRLSATVTAATIIETPPDMASIRSDLTKVLKLLEPQSPTRCVATPSTSTSCWYHAKFGARAKKCQQPCSFATPGNGQPSHQ